MRYIYISLALLTYQMIQRWSRYQILQQFLDFPRKGFLVRELSRNTKLAATAVRIHIKALMAEGLIKKENEGLYPSFKANKEDANFKLLKTQNVVFRLHQTGFISYLEKIIYPTCIVLFGSASNGEDTEKSDIDLLVQAKPAKVNLKRFEKLLNRKINLLFESNLKTLGPELLNNLANGIVVSGYLKVV